MKMPSRLSIINEELGITDTLLVSRGLTLFEEVEQLEVADISDSGKEHLLTPAAASAWRSMKAAALDDGISLSIVSAFRSIERQTEILRRKLNEGKGLEEVLSLSAPPGFSEHHTGRAIDITTPGVPALEVDFDQTPAFAWLSINAARHCFFLSYPVGNSSGFQYEPWHWCYRHV